MATKVICLKSLPSNNQLPGIQPASELLSNTNLVPPSMLIDRVLHRKTKGVLAASSKAGKSWVLLDLAFSVASGKPFLNFNTAQGRVLYINLEIADWPLKERMKEIQNARGLETTANLDTWNLRGEDVNIDSLAATLRLRESAQYALIIIDPIYRLMVGGSENSSQTVNKLCRDIDRLMLQSGCAVVYAHHFTKGRQFKKKPVDRMSGSGVFARDADTIINLTEHRQENCFVVETTLRNLPLIKPFVVEYVHPCMVVRPCMDPAQFRENEGHEMAQVDVEVVAGCLTEQPVSFEGWRALAVESGISIACFQRCAARLEHEGRVKREMEGWMRVTDSLEGGGRTTT